MPDKEKIAIELSKFRFGETVEACERDIELYYRKGVVAGYDFGEASGKAEEARWWVEHWNKFCDVWDTCGHDDRAVLYLRIEMDARAKEVLNGKKES